MSWRKYVGFLSAAALVGVVAAANGCSSSNKSAPSDAGSDAVVIHKEAGTSSGAVDSGEEAEAGALYDGTTGLQCTKDSDCNAKAGINVCSIDYVFTVTAEKAMLWPTPICLPKIPTTGGGAGNCDPCGISAGGACGDGAIWGCDSDPTTLDPTSSPGLCLPNNPSSPVANEGICIPRCELPADGSTPTGCVGKDTCVAYTWLLTQSGSVDGIGFCQGSCQQDSDCSGLGTGFVCQTDIGFCVQASAPTTRTKSIGTACTGGSASTSDSTTGACNCEANNTTEQGYCTSACVIGGNACPDGYVCDGFFPYGPLVFGDASTQPALTKQNTGAVGTCIDPCTSVDGGAPEAGAGDGGACPPNSSCVLETLAGPDCLP